MLVKIITITIILLLVIVLIINNLVAIKVIIIVILLTVTIIIITKITYDCKSCYYQGPSRLGWAKIIPSNPKDRFRV